MEVRELKTLLALMQDFGLVELEIEDKKGKVRLVRAGAAVSAIAPLPAAASVVAAPTPTPLPTKAKKTAGSSANGGRDAEPPVLTENQRLVASPMVGTFYRAASPDSEPFVEEGTQVRKGQPLCLIEAMKMMNEIEADTAGRVVRILVDNGNPVEYGQPLMILEIG